MSLLTLSSTQAARQWCDEQRRLGNRIGFVPTMGALHDGHLSLIKQAKKEQDVVCVSIFINPHQFDNIEDYKSYPHNLKKDYSLLQEAQVEMCFTASASDVFPTDPDFSSIPNHVAFEGLEGFYRPGHLHGVWAVVEKLFYITGECIAYFGEKDFQQTQIIKALCEHLKPKLKITTKVCPTIRDHSGLAHSSRNQNMDEKEKARAAIVYKALLEAKTAWLSGTKCPKRLEELMLKTFLQQNISVEYASIRDPNNWTKNTPNSTIDSAQALIAVWVGKTRLIDNLFLG